MSNQSKTPGVMVLVRRDLIGNAIDYMEGSQSAKVTLWREKLIDAVEQTPAVGGEPVGRFIEPGPRYKGAEKIPQIRSYAEYSKQAVSESNGYWLEGELVYRNAHVAPLLAEIEQSRLGIQFEHKVKRRLEDEVVQLKVACGKEFESVQQLSDENLLLKIRLAELEAQLGK